MNKNKTSNFLNKILNTYLNNLLLCFKFQTSIIHYLPYLIGAGFSFEFQSDQLDNSEHHPLIIECDTLTPLILG